MDSVVSSDDKVNSDGASRARKEAKRKRSEKNEKKEEKQKKKDEEKEEKNRARKHKQAKSGKLALQEIKVLIDGNIDTHFKTLFEAALDEENVPHATRSLQPSASLHWEWQPTGGGSQKPIACVLQILSHHEFIAKHVSHQLAADAVCTEAPFSVVVHGLRGFVQQHATKQYKRHVTGSAESWVSDVCPWSSWPDVERTFAQTWFASGGRVRYLEEKSVEDAVRFALATTKRLAEAPYKSQDNALTLAKSSKSAGQKGGSIDEGASYASLGDSWENYLGQVTGISGKKAKTVVNEYPTFATLMSAYEACAYDNERAAELKGLKVLGSTQVLGPVLSRRIFELMWSTDGTASSGLPGTE
jgi:hypothetical protein